MTKPDGGLFALNNIGLLEFLDYDEKPTFIFDLQKFAETTDWSLKVVYLNPFLRSSQDVLAELLGFTGNETSAPITEIQQRSFFEQWLTGRHSSEETSSPYSQKYFYHNLLWTQLTLRKRWVVATGISVDPSETSLPITPRPFPTPPIPQVACRLVDVETGKHHEQGFHLTGASHEDPRSEAVYFDDSTAPQLVKRRRPSSDQSSESCAEPRFEFGDETGGSRQPTPDYNAKSLDTLGSKPKPPSFWDETLRALEANKLDVPLAIAYAIEDCDDPNIPDGSRIISFKAAVGVPSSHALLLKDAVIDQNEGGLMRTFRDAMEYEGPRLLCIDGRTLPRKVRQRDNTGRVWTDVVVTRLSAGNQTFGFLLIGLNPRRVQDDDYKRFAILLSKQISTSLTALVLLNKAKSTEAALSDTVTRQLKEAAESEQRFEALAELSPVGMYCLSLEGDILYANDSYFEMTGRRSSFTTPTLRRAS